ncbi:prepilin-type N-terminal cleavage/methylation domain-containing protein [Chloroflexota bacterium]
MKVRNSDIDHPPVNYKEYISHSGQQAGFTLLEMVISVVLLGLIGVGVIRGVQTISKSNQIMDEQIQASNLATMYVEVIRQLPFNASDPPYPNAGAGIVIPSQYAVDVDAEYSTNGETWNETYSGQKLQKVIIDVSRTSGKSVSSFCYYRIDFPGE